jgi:hypothetical protein
MYGEFPTRYFARHTYFWHTVWPNRGRAPRLCDGPTVSPLGHGSLNAKWKDRVAYGRIRSARTTSPKGMVHGDG